MLTAEPCSACQAQFVIFNRRLQKSKSQVRRERQDYPFVSANKSDHVYQRNLAYSKIVNTIERSVGEHGYFLVWSHLMLSILGGEVTCSACVMWLGS